MIKHLNQKLLFLGIIIAVLSVPVFAYGQEQQGAYCFTFFDREGYVWGTSDYVNTSRHCRPTLEECQSWKKTMDDQGGTGSDDLEPEEGDYTTTCKYIPPNQDGSSIPERTTLSEEVPEPGGCSIFNWDAVGCAKIITSWSISVILWLLSWVLWLANQIFNLAIQISIVDFAKYAKMKAVTMIWSMGRDLANIFFIFILIYIAIATIIQKAGGQTKQMVVKLIITALLINFSIIIPKVIIDVGNSLAIVFYNNMGSPGVNGAPDISGTLVRGANPAQFYGSELDGMSKLAAGDEKPSVGDPSADQARTAASLNWSTIILKGLGTGILILVLSYVLLVATYLFFVRTITLIILISTSSLVFFSRIIPSELNLNYWDKWFQTLIKETFFAPAFLFMFYLVLKIALELPTMNNAPDPNTTPGSANLTALAAGATGDNNTWGDQIFGYVLLVGLAFGTIIVARKMATWSGKLAGQIKDKVSENGGAWVARNTAGRAASKLADSKGMKTLASARLPIVGGLAGLPGKYARRGLQNVASAKFGGGKEGIGFTEQQKKYTDKAKADMGGMSEEQKTRYVSNISSSWAGDKGKNMLQAERIKDLKTPGEQYAALSAIKDIKQQGKILKEMSDGSVAKLLTKAPPGEFEDVMNEMDPERRQKIEKMKKEEITRQEATVKSEELKGFEKNLKDGTLSKEEIIKQLAELKKGDVKKLDEEAVAKIPKDAQTISGMNPLSIVELYKRKDLGEGENELKKTLKELRSIIDRPAGISILDASGRPTATEIKIGKDQESAIKALTNIDSMIKKIMDEKD